MQKYQKSQEIYGAILVQENELNSLILFLKEHFNNLEFFGKTKDETTIRFKDFSELINYQNTKKRLLTEIKISARQDDKSIQISFNEYYFFKKPKILRYNLSYDDDNWGFKFDDDLQNKLEEFVPWYSLTTYFQLSFFLPIFVITLLFLYIGLGFILQFFNLPTYLSVNLNDPVVNKRGDFLLMFWVIPIYIISFIIEKARDYLFPRFFIAIGKQKKEFEYRKWWRNGVIFVIVISVIANKISQFL